MITFMIATLGSLIFWVIYFMITLVIGMAIMRKKYPGVLRYTTTGIKGYGEPFEYVTGAILIFTFWPIILIGLIIGFIFRSIIGPLVMSLLKTINRIIPDINITINKDN